MDIKLSDVMKHFSLDCDVNEYGNGHINNTYLVKPDKYILQKINTNIFCDPDSLMENIVQVTEFLKDKIAKDNGDTKRETLTVVKTSDDKNF